MNRLVAIGLTLLFILTLFYYIPVPVYAQTTKYEIIIDNTQNSNSLTNYQVLLTVNNDPDFFNNITDPTYIEIYDSDNATLLSFWIEEWDTTNYNAKIWIKVPNIPGGQNKTIYLAVNTARTTSLSNGTATFLFFDDFEDLTLDTSKWNTYKQGSTLATIEEITFDNRGVLHLAGEPNVISSANVESIFNFTSGILVYLKHYITEEHYADVSFGYGNLVGVGGATSWWHTTFENGYVFSWQSPVSGGSSIDLAIDRMDAGAYTILVSQDTGGLTSLNAWHTLEYIYDENGNLKWYHDGTLWLSTTDTTYLNSTKSILISQGEYSNGYGGDRYIDIVFVRKYSDPEPAVTYKYYAASDGGGSGSSATYTVTLGLFNLSYGLASRVGSDFYANYTLTQVDLGFRNQSDFSVGYVVRYDRLIVSASGYSITINQYGADEDGGGGGQEVPTISFTTIPSSIYVNDYTLFLFGAAVVGFAYLAHPVMGIVALIGLAISGYFGVYGFIVVFAGALMIYLLYARGGSGGDEE